MTVGLVAVLDARAAERRAEEIRLRLGSIADNYDAVMPMIRDAITARDDLALGYRSVGDYVSDRFGGAMQRLGVEVRRAVVQELTAAGMSSRAIAPVVGVSHMTVARDAAGVTPVTPPNSRGEGNSASGADDPAQTEATSGVNRPEDYPEAPAPAPRPAAPVVGIDGKTYSRPAPVDHTTKADAAVAEFPDLAYYRDDKRDPEHCWRLAEKLREYRDRGELDERLANLRRSIAYDRGDLPPAAPAAVAQSTTCPACGQDTTNLRSAP